MEDGNIVNNNDKQTDYSHFIHLKKDERKSDDFFINNTTLRNFLDYICQEENRTIDHSKINTNQDALNFILSNIPDSILKEYKAKKYVGVGVGGLVVHENNGDAQVLLYLRPKNPEQYKWSMVGGSIEFGQNATDTLIQEFKNIIGYEINKNDLTPLRITNHKIGPIDHCEYHYLSPAYLVKCDGLIEYVNRKIRNEKQKNDQKKRALLKKIIIPNNESRINELIMEIAEDNYYLKQWEPALKNEINKPSLDKYIIKWFKISEIKDNSVFSIPTVKAIQSYNNRKTEINRLKTKANELGDKISLLFDVADTLGKEIVNIRLTDIIESDD